MSTGRGPQDAAEVYSRLEQRGYWSDMCPDFPIGPGTPGRAVDDAEPVDPGLLERVRTEGYCIVPEALDNERTGRVLKLIDRLARQGWPPAFAFLYDEPWAVFRSAPVRRIVTALLGEGYVQLPDFFAWRIPARDRAHGYRPHREAEQKGMTEADGTPNALTVWIPLTDATTDNGCMHVLPRNVELFRFLDADLKAMYGTQPTSAALAMLHRARALPAPAGSVLCWNHEIIHWGGFSSAAASNDRVSFAFEFLRNVPNGFVHEHSVFNPPAPSQPPVTLNPADALPTFEQRRYLLAKAVCAYNFDRAGDIFFEACGMYLARSPYPA